MTSISEAILKRVLLLLTLSLFLLGCREEEPTDIDEINVITSDTQIIIEPVSSVPNKKLLKKIDNEVFISAFRVKINNGKVNDLSLVSRVLIHHKNSEYIKEPSTLVLPIDLSFSSEIFCVITQYRDEIKLYQTDLGVIVGGRYSIKDFTDSSLYQYNLNENRDLDMGQAITLFNYSSLDNREDLENNLTDVLGTYFINTMSADQISIDIAIYKNYMFK